MGNRLRRGRKGRKKNGGLERINWEEWLAWAVVEVGLTPDSFWSMTPRELKYLSQAASAKAKRELRIEAHFTACLINSILGSLSKDYQPIKGGILLGEDESEGLTEDQKWAMIGG